MGLRARRRWWVTGRPPDIETLPFPGIEFGLSPRCAPERNTTRVFFFRKVGRTGTLSQSHENTLSAPARLRSIAHARRNSP